MSPAFRLSLSSLVASGVIVLRLCEVFHAFAVKPKLGCIRILVALGKEFLELVSQFFISSSLEIFDVSTIRNRRITSLSKTHALFHRNPKFMFFSSTTMIGILVQLGISSKSDLVHILRQRTRSGCLRWSKLSPVKRSE